jgi:hypothetical protein
MTWRNPLPSACADAQDAMQYSPQPRFGRRSIKTRLRATNWRILSVDSQKRVLLTTGSDLDAGTTRRCTSGPARLRNRRGGFDKSPECGTVDIRGVPQNRLSNHCRPIIRTLAFRPIVLPNVSFRANTINQGATACQ